MYYIKQQKPLFRGMKPYIITNGKDVIGRFDTIKEAQTFLNQRAS